MSKTNIEWTQHTWNPMAGCSILSPGCTNCYAMKMARRIEAMNAALPPSQHQGEHYNGTTRVVNGNAVWTGKIGFSESALLRPLKRKVPTTWFVNSMSDLFHEAVPDEAIDKVFAVMALTPQHTYQVLTKRSSRMQAYMTSARERIVTRSTDGHENVGIHTAEVYRSTTKVGGAFEWPLPNVWLGVSTERQQEADERIPDLLATPAAVRFISAEPLLGPIDLRNHRVCDQCGNTPHKLFSGDPLCPQPMPVHDSFQCPLHWWPSDGCDGTLKSKIDWVIVGGESGPGARPMHPDWARSLRDQCTAAGVPFFFKQWGEYLPVGQSLPGCGKVHGATAVKPGRMKLHYGGTPQQAPKRAFAERGVEFTSTADGRLTFRVGKAAAGRALDGLIHDEYPANQATCCRTEAGRLLGKGI